MIRNNKVLWTIQILLAALYLFAGGFKVVASAAAMSQPDGSPGPLPIWFLRTVGMLECLGALGLILPGLTGIKRGLTPIAAWCLVVIMIGAVVTSIPLGWMTLILPIVAGLLDIVVATGRRDWLRPSATMAGAQAAR
jgi:hypothetical protein